MTSNPKTFQASNVQSAVWHLSFLNILNRGAGLLTSLIIFHYLDPASYGVWRIALSAVAFILPGLGSLTPLVITETIRTKLGGEAYGSGLTLWRGFVRMTFVASIFCMGMGMLFFPFLARYFGIGNQRLIVLALLLLPLWSLKASGLAWLNVSYAFHQQIKIQTIEYLVYISLLILFLSVLHQGVWGLGFATVGGAMASLICVLPILRESWFVSNSTFREEVRAYAHLLRQHGKWALAGQGLRSLLDSGRIWLLGIFVGPAAVGLFGLADSLIGYLMSLVNSAPALLAAFPRLVQDPPRLVQAFTRSIRIGTLLSIILFVASWSLIGPAVFLLFPKFVAAHELFRVQSLVILLGGISVGLTGIYTTLRWQKKIFWLLAIRVSFSFLFLLILLPRWGIWAVAWEYVLSTTLFVFLRFERFYRVFTFRLRDGLMPRLDDVKTLFDFFCQKIFRKQRPL